MIPNRCWGGFVLMVIGGLVSAGPVIAQAPEVKDEAGFFSSAAVHKARQGIKEMKLLYNKDLRLETFPGVPADKAARFKGLKDAADRSKFMSAWARSRAQALHVDGIYILVCKTPATLEIIVDLKTTQKVFPAAERNKLRDVLVANFKAKKYDQGLAEAVTLVDDTLDLHLTSPPPAPVAGTIRDYAGLFGPDTVAKATAAVKDIREKRPLELTIETLGRVQPGQRRKVANMAAPARADFFRDWARQRARLAKADGVWVLICKKPAHIQVSAGGAAVQQGRFTRAERDAVQELLIRHFGKKEFDQGLLQAVAFVAQPFQKPSTPPKEAEPVVKKGTPPTKEETLKAVNTAPVDTAEKTGPKETRSSAAAGPTFDPMWIVWGVLILLGLWILIGLLRALFGRGTRPVPQGQPYPSSQPYPAPPQAYAQGQPPYGQGPAPGYGGRPPMPYQGPGYGQAPPPPAQGGGGGFLSSMLGGMFGGAAGGWIYDKFSGRSASSSGGSPPVSYPQASHPPAARPAGGAAGAGAAGYVSSSSDFDDKTADQGGYASSGGSFAAPPAKQTGYAGGGADFGDADSTPANSGGDFGEEDSQTASAGADFGEEDTKTAGGGADFGEEDTKAADAGGDFGSETADQLADNNRTSGGGDFGRGAAEPEEERGGDFGVTEPGGGDFNSEPAEPAAESAGDFGGPESGGTESAGDFDQSSADPGAPASSGDFGSADAKASDPDSSEGNF